jgi:hypothetical protein
MFCNMRIRLIAIKTEMKLDVGWTYSDSSIFCSGYIVKATVVFHDIKTHMVPLCQLIDALELSKETMKTVKQNLWWAFLYNIVCAL